MGTSDDPVRHERLAAIGKNGTQIRLHKKDDVFIRVPFLLENRHFETEKMQFSPIISLCSLLVTFRPFHKRAKIKAFL